MPTKNFDVNIAENSPALDKIKQSIPDISNLATKTELNTGLTTKQDILVNQTNIKSINDESLIGEGNIEIKTPEPIKQFTDEEVQRIKKFLENGAWGINKVTENLEFKGIWTPFKFYNDLDKTDNNMVTDNLGNDLPNIRSRANFHYAQNMWYDEEGNIILEAYQGKLTYKNKEIATTDGIYSKLREESVNADKYIFNDFDNSKWYLFNVEYAGGDNKDYSGTLERMAGLTLLIKDCNVGNDFGASSSATIIFDGNTKTLEVKRWEQTNLKIKKITIFQKVN